MNKIKFITFLLLLNIGYNAYGEYYPLKCSGLLPKTFQNQYYTRACNNYEKNKDSLEYGKVNDAREYYHSNQYFLKDLLLSGNVIFGDPISKALQIQADLIAEKFNFNTTPKIYLLRSTEANAFATQTGAIFITTALVSCMDNFYELTYILCHELVHISQDHLYKKFIERMKIKNKHYKYRPWKMDELIENYYLHSREDEYQADGEGYNYFTSMKWPQEMAISALEKLDSSGISPFYTFSFDSILSLNAHLPGLTIEKNELRPFLDLQFRYQKTHPEFVDRFDSLKKQKVDSYLIEEIEASNQFSEFKSMAINETLYSYYLDHEYYPIIAFYHLSEHKYCDKKFLNFLYAKSLYTILKVRLVIEQERLEYDPNTIVVELNGPLHYWINMIEPKSMYGPERPFIKYFKEISNEQMWSITSKAILLSYNESDYFYNPLIFDDCLNIYDDLKLDTLKADDEIGSVDSLRNDLESASKDVEKKYDLLQFNEPNILLIPYEKKPSSSTLSQSKIDYEVYDELILKIFLDLQIKYSNVKNIESPYLLNDTKKINEYITLNRFLNQRNEFSLLEVFDCSLPSNEFLNFKQSRFMMMAQKVSSLYLYSFQVNFKSGEIETSSYFEMKKSDDTKAKMSKLIKKYYESNPLDSPVK